MSKILLAHKTAGEKVLAEGDFIEKGGDKQVHEVLNNGQVESDVKGTDTFVDDNGQVTLTETNNQGLDRTEKFNVGN